MVLATAGAFTSRFVEFSEGIPHKNKSRYFTNRTCQYISNSPPNIQLNSYITLSLPDGPPYAYP